MRKRKIERIKAHRRAYRNVERRLTRHIYRSIFHDLDKIFLLRLGLNPRTVSRIHRSYSLHHETRIGLIDVVGAVIDWECARLTKADKPLNARDTLRVHYPHLQDRVAPVLERLGL